MKALITRIRKGKVCVNGEIISSIDRGLAVFVGIERKDTQDDIEKMADKIVNLRIFENEEGKLHYSVKDKNYRILCVSNFTLCAKTDRGRRPSFDEAMRPEAARKLFDCFVSMLRSKGAEVHTGAFGEHMDIDVEMDGPVNIVLNI